MIRSRPVLASCLVVGILLIGVAGWSRADDAEAPPIAPPVDEAVLPEDGSVGGNSTEASAEASPGLGTSEFEKMVLEGPIAAWAFALLKFLPAALGLVFLILGYRAWSRRRAGLLPPLERPPEGPTRPFELVPALLLLLVCWLFAALVVTIVTAAAPDTAASFAFGAALMTLILLPAALITVWKRQQLRGGWRTPPRRALRMGFVTFSVGTAIALPLAVVGGLVLYALGVPPTVQRAVEQAVDPSQPLNLWLVLVFGVIFAPFQEEAVFRGLLYPALRQRLGRGRHGFWIAAILVSLLFALIHDGWYARVPLLGLALVLVVIFEYTDSLSTVVFGHAFFNASSMVPIVIARLEGAV